MGFLCAMAPLLLYLRDVDVGEVAVLLCLGQPQRGGGRRLGEAELPVRGRDISQLQTGDGEGTVNHGREPTRQPQQN